MIAYKDYLKKYPEGLLVAEGGGKLGSGIFRFLFAEGNNIYFCSSVDKQIYDLLKSHPDVKFNTFTLDHTSDNQYPPDYIEVLSVRGKVYQAEDEATRQRGLDEDFYIKSIFRDTKNPEFKLFYIKAEEIEAFKFTQQPGIYKLS